MKWLASLIKLIHLLIIVGLIASVFVKSGQWKQLALTLLIFLLIQYICGFEKCGLTELEYYIMGENHKQGFIYRLVNPLIRIPEKYLYDGKFVIHLLLIGVLTYQLSQQKCF